MLKYEREDLLGKDLSQIWWSETERADFVSCVREGQSPCKKEVMLVAKDGTPDHYPHFRNPYHPSCCGLFCNRHGHPEEG